MATRKSSSPKSGLPIDSSGGPTVDPTANVIALSAASTVRQDDLREAQDRLVHARLAGLEQITLLRADHVKEIAAAESLRVNEQLSLRAAYEERLALAEAKRIDAIRAVDVNAVSVASQRAGDQATALATQVAQSAEVLRNQVAQSAEALRALVATTAATQQQNQQTQNSALSNRITTLEQAQSEGKGKQSYSDPAFAELLSEVKGLRQVRASNVGEGLGRTEVIGWIVAAAAVGGFLVHYMKP